jgi:hypothetical protein
MSVEVIEFIYIDMAIFKKVTLTYCQCCIVDWPGKEIKRTCGIINQHERACFKRLRKHFTCVVDRETIKGGK